MAKAHSLIKAKSRREAASRRRIKWQNSHYWTPPGREGRRRNWRTNSAAWSLDKTKQFTRSSRAYQSHVTGLSPAGRPIGNFLFLGPTGSGKTRIVEATAQSLLNDPKAVIKIDCAEFQHSHEIAKLIGSPPGYLGHRETHALLSQEALNRHHTDKIKLSLVLFDEIEKASDALWNLLLGILDKGVLTLGDNRKVDFSSSMIFLTSNLGASRNVCPEQSAAGLPLPRRRGRRFSGGPGSGCRASASPPPAASSRRSSSTVWTRSWFSNLWAMRNCAPILDIELEMVQQRLQDRRRQRRLSD